MLKKMFVLVLGLSAGILTTGCGAGTTAAEIADSYGVLNRYNLQPAIAQVIQSGQADFMIEQGQAKVRRTVRGCGKDRLLISEFLIQGEPYRIEVRRAVDPTNGIDTDRIYYVESEADGNYRYIDWFNAAAVWKCIRDHSYEAQPVVAYRAWQGTDGKIRGVKVQAGPTPNWASDDNAVNVNIRTKDWPIVGMWFRGLTSDGRPTPPDGLGKDYDVTDNSLGHVNQAAIAPDGRWIMEAQGPSKQVPTQIDGQGHFINYKLYDKVK